MRQVLDINKILNLENTIMFREKEISEYLPLESDREIAEELIKACCGRPLDMDGVERPLF
jgi:hypothetical protein